mgnify:CR=1 FL=1
MKRSSSPNGMRPSHTPDNASARTPTPMLRSWVVLTVVSGIQRDWPAQSTSTSQTAATERSHHSRPRAARSPSCPAAGPARRLSIADGGNSSGAGCTRRSRRPQSVARPPAPRPSTPSRRWETVAPCASSAINASRSAISRASRSSRSSTWAIAYPRSVTPKRMLLSSSAVRAPPVGKVLPVCVVHRVPAHLSHPSRGRHRGDAQCGDGDDGDQPLHG